VVRESFPSVYKITLNLAQRSVWDIHKMADHTGISRSLDTRRLIPEKVTAGRSARIMNEKRPCVDWPGHPSGWPAIRESSSVDSCRKAG